MPMMIAPSANLTGVDGWRAPSFVQIAAKTPERMMMKIGLIDCTHDTGISQPKIVAVEPLVGVDREHRELLLVQRPEADVHDEQRDEAEDARALGRRDAAADERITTK